MQGNKVTIGHMKTDCKMIDQWDRYKYVYNKLYNTKASFHGYLETMILLKLREQLLHDSHLFIHTEPLYIMLSCSVYTESSMDC